MGKQEVKRFICLVILPLTLVGCSFSFSNISTHGVASDLVDEEQEASSSFHLPASIFPK
jgi:hypothetical protein